MAIKVIGQLGFADDLVGKRLGSNAMLERIDRLIDWASIEALLDGLHSSRHGRPAFPPLALFKALLLQQWYGLSETGLEDRLSFRRFCGLTLEDGSPDQVTINRFRHLLVGKSLMEPLFDEIVRQIDVQGLILRQGTLIDASLVAAAVRRPKLPKDEVIAESEIAGKSEGKAASDEVAKPRPASKLVSNPLDPDAAWAKKGGKRSFGYKAHIGADKGSAIIRRALLTPANVNDTVPADDLYCGDEKAVYADQAYSTKARTARLKAAGIKDRTMSRANKHHPLTPRQKLRNEAIGKRRGPVEQVFARLKGFYRWTRVRYRGLAVNAAHLLLMCSAMNLRRMAVLTPSA